MMTTLSSPRPLLALVITVASIAVAEAAVMIGFSWLPWIPRWALATLDSAVLLALLSPALYLLIYRPQARLLTERQRTAAALEEAKEQLERRVLERTQQIGEANGRLDENVRQLQIQNRETTLLAEMVGVFQACRTTEEAHAVIGRCASLLFPADSGVLYVFKASRNLVEPVASWGGPNDGPQGHAFEPGECWALRRGRPHTVAADCSTTVCQHLDQNNRAVSICVPMMAEGEGLGVLVLRLGDSVPNSRESTACGVESRLRLATTAGEHIALALANLRLRETLRHQALRDPLTGLFNRRYLEETQSRELRRAERRGLPLGVVAIDIDHFKRFNDTFGHEAGDAVLVQLANFLRTSVRAEDIACRLGGEEFALFLPEATLDVARRRADSLREGLKGLVVRHRGETLGGVTVSMGVAAFPAHGATVEELWQAADRALYRAKEQGRDRIAVAE